MQILTSSRALLLCSLVIGSPSRSADTPVPPVSDFYEYDFHGADLRTSLIKLINMGSAPITVINRATKCNFSMKPYEFAVVEYFEAFKHWYLQFTTSDSRSLARIDWAPEADPQNTSKEHRCGSGCYDKACRCGSGYDDMESASVGSPSYSIIGSPTCRFSPAKRTGGTPGDALSPVSCRSEAASPRLRRQASSEQHLRGLTTSRLTGR